MTYHNVLCFSPRNFGLHKLCLQFLLGVKMAPRETEDNAYAKFWGEKQRALWYVMVFSGVVNSLIHKPQKPQIPKLSRPNCVTIQIAVRARSYEPGKQCV